MEAQDSPEFRDALMKFAQAPSAQARAMLEDHPDLVSDLAEQHLAMLIEIVRENDDKRSEATLVQATRRIRLCREGRIDDAFDEEPPPLIPADLMDKAVAAADAHETYSRTGDIKALSDSIATWDEILAERDLENVSPAMRSIALAESATALLDRYRRNGEASDLDMAIKRWATAEDEMPVDAPAAPALFDNLAVGHLLRFTDSGRASDLEVATTFANRAVENEPEASELHPKFQLTLAGCLHETFLRDGALTDLNRAIEHYHVAVENLPEDSPSYASALNNYASGLRERFTRLKDPADQEAAAHLQERAVAATPEHATDRIAHLSNLAIGADWETGLRLREETFEASTEDSPERPALLHNLGTSHMDRFLATFDPEAIDKAIYYFEEALHILEPESPDLPLFSLNAGKARRLSFDLQGDFDDLIRGMDVLETACKTGLAVSPQVALEAAQFWGDWNDIGENWSEATRAYAYGLEAADHLYRTQLDRGAKEVWLREIADLPSRAACAAARAGDIPGAVVAMERGRAVLLSEALNLKHADLDRMRESGHADLCDRFEQLATRWDELSSGLYSPDGELRLADALRDVRGELDDAVLAIRQVSGYERFLELPELPDLTSAAIDGPLVYITAGDNGGLALIVWADREPAVDAVWLDSLTTLSLEDVVGAFAMAEDVGAHDEESAEAPVQIDDLLRWVWDAVMEPVVEAIAPASKATLIPAGRLSLVPLHAAFTDDEDAPGGCRYAADMVRISYAPNALALHAARRVAADIGSDALLAIGNPQPVTEESLPAAAAEATEVATYFEERSVLLETEATRDEVLEQLSSSSIWHFACHGQACLEDPLESGLVMANDEMIRVRDIAELVNVEGRLAVLSACETAVPGAELPDEVIGLPTGLLQAGVAGVVASLWAVSDVSAMIMMLRFYELWKRDRIPPPEALQSAQTWVRDTTNQEKLNHLSEIRQGRETDDAPGAVRQLLEEALRELPPAERAFAHPLDWAAFTYVGV